MKHQVPRVEEFVSLLSGIRSLTETKIMAPAEKASSQGRIVSSEDARSIPRMQASISATAFITPQTKALVLFFETGKRKSKRGLARGETPQAARLSDRLFDLGVLTHSVTEIVKTCAANFTFSYNFNVYNVW